MNIPLEITDRLRRAYCHRARQAAIGQLRIAPYDSTVITRKCADSTALIGSIQVAVVGTDADIATKAACGTISIPGAERKVSDGTLRCAVQRFSPDSASKAVIRLSRLRTITRPWPTAGDDSTSLDVCAFQRNLPSAS